MDRRYCSLQSPLFVFTSATSILTLRLIVISTALSSGSSIHDPADLEDTRRRVYWQLLVCFPAALYFLHRRIEQRRRSPPPTPADNPRYNNHISRRPGFSLTIEHRCLSWPSPFFVFASATVALTLRLVAIGTALSSESSIHDPADLEATRRRVYWQLLVCFPAALYFLRKKIKQRIDPRYTGLAHYVW
ncbi:unnamed protein product [Linum trigynum]|uniref:Uncharacterized protein n=1 Tax=Linum trigynum TaxID=586398 RepID=A0AAV2ENF3_9ROSI